MKTGLIIATYNRPDYLKQCFDSLKHVTHGWKDVELIIVDDASTEITPALFVFNHQAHYIFKPERKGICDSLLQGYDWAFEMGCDFVMNLDSDAIVRNDFITKMQALHAAFPDDIITGFNCHTKNRDGSERHVMTGGGEWYNFKKSVGGINMGMNRAAYEKHVKPALQHCFAHGGNWDHVACLSAGRAVSVQPSVVQHIGINSAMNHNEPPDVADDFKPLYLKDVTLVCVDDNQQRALQAMNKCREQVMFEKSVCVFASDQKGKGGTNNHTNIGIERLGSKEAYSAFIINELHKYITTSHVLIVQHDGYVKNWQAWTDEFLQYDYIGALWWYQDGLNMGNGGFSLRSLKLLKMTAAANWPVTHPEDHVICRIHRREFEEQGVKFAPDELAAKFSFEGANQFGQWAGQFGFHGERALRNVQAAKYPQAVNRQPQQRKPLTIQQPQGLIFNQFLGLGDILFLVPMARHYISLGHDIIWPVADEYQADLKRHFPDIQFVRKSAFPMQYDSRAIYMHRWQYGVYKVLPLRWNICHVPDCSDCMTSKYTMMGLDWKMWRGLKWERNYFKEGQLPADLEMKYPADFEYELHCGDFGCEVSTNQKKSKELPSTGLPIINLKTTSGYSLLDWSLIIENATIIHAVSSSTLYMFEMLDLKAREINLYGREQGMKDHVFVRDLRTKEYILHE